MALDLRQVVQAMAQALLPKTATEMGYKPFNVPSALASQGYTNQYGVTMGPCTYCGYCTNYGCANYSKASAIVNVLPAVVSMPNFEARTNCEVLEVLKDSSGKKATGVVYIDSNGERCEQPASIVIVAAFTFENVRLMLLSNVGVPYDPVTGKGTTGRNYCFQTAKGVRLFLKDQTLNPLTEVASSGMETTDSTTDILCHWG